MTQDKKGGKGPQGPKGGRKRPTPDVRIKDVYIVLKHVTYVGPVHPVELSNPDKGPYLRYGFHVGTTSSKPIAIVDEDQAQVENIRKQLIEAVRAWNRG